jgi:hypothetical protein
MIAVGRDDLVIADSISTALGTVTASVCCDLAIFVANAPSSQSRPPVSPTMTYSPDLRA